MKTFSAVTLLPFLNPSPLDEVDLGCIKFRPYPWQDRQEKEPLLGHLERIRAAFGCRYDTFVADYSFDSWEEFKKKEAEIEKAVMAFRFSVLSYPYSHYGGKVSLDQTDRFTLVYGTKETAKDTFGYEVFRNGKHADYIRSKWDLVIPGAPANHDTEALQVLLPKAQDDQLRTSLEAFNKSCRSTNDNRDHIIFLSIALEALLEKKETDWAEQELVRILKEAGVGSAAADVLRKARETRILVQGISRALREEVESLTGSKEITQYVSRFYTVGSKIRHGVPVSEEESGWFGENQHLYRPDFSRKLFLLLVRELRFPKPTTADEHQASDTFRKLMVLSLEEMLEADKDRISAIDTAFSSRRTAAEKLQEIYKHVSFQRDPSVGEASGSLVLKQLAQSLNLVRTVEPNIYAGITKAAEPILSGATAGMKKLQVGEICYLLEAQTRELGKVTEAQVVIWKLSGYCAFLHRYG